MFDEKKIQEIVTYKKRKDLKKKYIEGYNACDGSKIILEIAEIIGVAQSTLSPILQEWEDIGIIYEVQKSGGKFYKKIFPI